MGLLEAILRKQRPYKKQGAESECPPTLQEVDLGKLGLTGCIKLVTCYICALILPIWHQPQGFDDTWDYAKEKK